MPEERNNLKQLQPPLHLLPAKTSAKLLLPSTMSLHVPATSVLAHGPLTHMPRVYAPHTDIDAYNEMCQCPKDVTELLALAHAVISIFINALILL